MRVTIESFKLELTQDEVSTVAYALKRALLSSVGSHYCFKSTFPTFARAKDCMLRQEKASFDMMNRLFALLQYGVPNWAEKEVLAALMEKFLEKEDNNEQEE